MSAFIFFLFSSNNSYNKTKELISILKASCLGAVPLTFMRRLWASAFGCFTLVWKQRKKHCQLLAKSMGSPCFPTSFCTISAGTEVPLKGWSRRQQRWELLCPTQPSQWQIRLITSCVEGFCSHPGSPQASGQIFCIVRVFETSAKDCFS